MRVADSKPCNSILSREQESKRDWRGHTLINSTCISIERSVLMCPVLLLDEVVDRETVGTHTGQVKWFNDRLGYGFITLCSENQDKPDVFVHHTSVRPISSKFNSLRKGEYTSFNLSHGQQGPQAVDVTGFGGGTLMCDVTPVRRMYQDMIKRRVAARLEGSNLFEARRGF